MSNETKTAVQILVDGLIKLGYLHSNDFGQSPKVTEVINQAKEMEKEQIVNAFEDGQSELSLKDKHDYYKETYGGNK
jgi:hypothetical protein